MGLLGKAFMIALTVPFVVGLYVLGNKPGFAREVLVAYDTSGVLGVLSAFAGAPDVLGVIGLAVLVVFIGPYLSDPNPP